jgi:hemicentin
VTAVNNTPISIDCPASGIPKPTITWEKDNEPLDVEDGYVVYKNGTLLIENATPDDSGRFKCIVKNIEGEDSETSTVDVVGKFKIGVFFIVILMAVPN